MVDSGQQAAYPPTLNDSRASIRVITLRVGFSCRCTSQCAHSATSGSLRHISAVLRNRRPRNDVMYYDTLRSLNLFLKLSFAFQQWVSLQVLGRGRTSVPMLLATATSRRRAAASRNRRPSSRSASARSTRTAGGAAASRSACRPGHTRSHAALASDCMDGASANVQDSVEASRSNAFSLLLIFVNQNTHPAHPVHPHAQTHNLH